MRSALSHHEHEQLADAVPAIVWRADRNGRRDYINQGWTRLTGRELAHGASERWLEAVHPDDVGGVVAALRDAFARGTAVELEYRLHRADGAWCWIVDCVAPCRDDEGRVTGFVGVSVDVHRRREAEHARVDFLTAIAHELRSPLQAVEAYLALLRHKSELGETLTAEVFDRAAQQFRRFSTLIADLSDATALERGHRLALDLEPVDLGPIVRSVVSLHQDTILRLRGHRDAQPHRITVDISGDTFPLLGDAVRLGQVTFNLLENALKYSPAGGEIIVELATLEDTHRFRVRDTGVGIPAEDLPRIRERFFRASNVSRAFPGTGVGLAIIQEIVQGHGGRLDVVSRLGDGTEVTVTLPRDRQA
jgi:PAS domain S-box-containing protein